MTNPFKRFWQRRPEGINKGELEDYILKEITKQRGVMMKSETDSTPNVRYGRCCALEDIARHFNLDLFKRS